MIKYLGSKRNLAPVLGQIAEAVGARTAVDLFTGTTRVAQEFKRRGIHVTAVDLATYSATLAEAYIATDADAVDTLALKDAIEHLDALPGQPGYVSATFCESARYFHPRNGARIDAIRDAIEEEFASGPLRPILLTALLLAADRVDSTTGQQMAYLKQWAPRALKELQLRPPELLPGPGLALRGDAAHVVGTLDEVDLMYLDPPYNQHRYFTNYHVWETLIRWDAPEHYGVACKRVDAREAATRSVFNSRRQMPAALHEVIQRSRARCVVVSYNDESWITPEEMTRSLLTAGHEAVRMLAFDSKRYVGAQIGVFNPDGVRVGTPTRLRNTEWLFLAGDREQMEAAAAVGAAAAAALAP